MAFYGPRGGEAGGPQKHGRAANVTPGANCASAWRIWKGCWKDCARPSPCGPRPADGPAVPWQAFTTWTRRAGGRYWKILLIYWALRC